MQVTIYAHPTKATACRSGVARWLVFKGTDAGEVSVCLDDLPSDVADALLAALETPHAG